MVEERRGEKNERRTSGGIVFANLTRRDWFAGQALTGILSKYGIDNKDHFMSQIAKDAYELAEEMERCRIEIKLKR